MTLQTFPKDHLHRKGDRVNKQTRRTKDINAEREDSSIRQPTTNSLSHYEPLGKTADEHGKYITIAFIRNHKVLNAVVEKQSG